jgi:hypothetical protein
MLHHGPLGEGTVAVRTPRTVAGRQKNIKSWARQTTREVLYIFVVAVAEEDFYILIQQRGGELI